MIMAGDFFMSLSRNDARIKAMTILYQIDLYKKSKIDYVKDDVIKDNLEDIDEFVLLLVNGVIDNISKIDEVANKYLGSWPINRLGLTDQAILRIAIYELLETDTPSKVIIDEAIEVAKKYSDDKVVGMINGVLDNIYHKELEVE